MSSGVIYSVTALVCLFQILLVIGRITETEYKDTVDKGFKRMLWFFALYCLTDTLWGVCDCNALAVSTGLFRFLCYACHLTSSLAIFAWYNYTMRYIKSERKDKRRVFIFSGCVLLIQFLMLIANIFTGDLFEVSAEGVYTVGTYRIYYYLLQLLLYFILFVYGAYILIARKNGKRKSWNIVLFSLVPICFSLGQYFFYDVAMYSMGFVVSAVAWYSFNVTVLHEQYLEEKMRSQKKRHASIISALAGDFESIYYIHPKSGQFSVYLKSDEDGEIVRLEKEMGDYFEAALKNSERYVLPEDLPVIKNLLNRENLEKALGDKGDYAITVRVWYKGEPTYFRYKYVRSRAKDRNDRIIVGVYNVDKEVKDEKEHQEQLRIAREREQYLMERTSQLSNENLVDALTGLFNRRAYENDIESRGNYPKGKHFTYASFDLNGLKVVNDNIGHEAGDELLKGAAECIQSCFGKYGKVYRTGGDEFVAMFTADAERLEGIHIEFEDTMRNWKGDMCSEISISYGCASRVEYPNSSIMELARIADKRMYQCKALHYSAKGIDRRGQQAAFQALCKSYAKIFRVNLTEDSFTILQLAEGEALTGDISKFTEWYEEFTSSGRIRPQDLEVFLKKTNLEYMRQYFKDGNQVLGVYYYRMQNGEYKKSMLEVMPAKEYSDDSQIVYMYVKCIEG